MDYRDYTRMLKEIARYHLEGVMEFRKDMIEDFERDYPNAPYGEFGYANDAVAVYEAAVVSIKDNLVAELLEQLRGVQDEMIADGKLLVLARRSSCWPKSTKIGKGCTNFQV